MAKRTKKEEKIEGEITPEKEVELADSDIAKPTSKKGRKKKIEEDFSHAENTKIDEKLQNAIMQKNLDHLKDDILSEDDEDDLTDEELEEEILETTQYNKGKKGKDGKKVSVEDMVHSEKELISLDDVKAKLLEIGKKNKNVVTQDDVDKVTTYLKLSDDDINEIWVYLTEKGIKLNDEDEDVLDEDDLEGDSFDDDGESFDSDKEEAFNEEEEDMLSAVDVKNSDPVRQYLHHIGTFQVFKNKEEEVICAQSILAGQKAMEDLQPILEEAFKAYEEECDKHDFQTFVQEEFPSTEEYTKDSFDELVKKKYPMVETSQELYNLMSLVDEGKSKKEELIQCNLKLVVSIAKHYVNRGMEFLDLIQEGNLGLMKAVDKFDYTRGFKFSTYATWWIRQAITRALADQARTIRIPVHMVETINKITRAQRKLVQKLNRDPTAEEISEELGGQWSASRIREIQQIALDPLSLEKPVGEEEDSHVGDFIEDKDNESPYEYANRSMETERINEVLSQLTDREAKVIRLRYGLLDGRTHTLEEVGKEFNVTRERIRQIEAKALKKLRHPARAKLLKDFRNDI